MKTQTSNTPRAFRKLMAGTVLIGTLLASGTALQAAQHDTELQQVQQRWALAVYKTHDKKAKYSALQGLSQTTTRLNQLYPNTAALLVWDGIVTSTLAAVQGGLGALGLAKKSLSQLERAKQLDANTLEGSVYTSMGALYSKVPGWPIGFGDDNKAEAHFKKALQINPNGIDPNYLYAEYLADKGQKVQAIQHLEKALKAPARQNRPVADEGRRVEARQLLDKLRAS